MAYTTHDTTQSTSIRSELGEHDWRVIRRIIDVVPPGETGIGALDDAYVQVMDETGAQDRHDVASIYHALLKIHEIKAPTLQARFQKYRAGVADRSFLPRPAHSSSAGERGDSRVINPTSTVGQVDDLLSETETEDSDAAPTIRSHRSQPPAASHSNDLKSRVPFLADADSDMAEDEPDMFDNACHPRAALPRYSTHAMDRKLAAGESVDNINVTFEQDIYRPLSRTARAPVVAEAMFEEPSFATDLLEMSTPIRTTTTEKRDTTDVARSTKDPGIPLAYAGPIYSSSSAYRGNGQAIDLDDTPLQGTYSGVEEESFNNTISSVPSPAPRIAAALPFREKETERVATIYRHRRDTSTSDTVEDTTINLELDELEREAEEMERRALAGTASGGRGKLELRLMRKKAESFWEFGLTLRTFRRWLQVFEYERIARTFTRWRDLKTRRDRSLRHASAIFIESSQRLFFSRWQDALRRARQEEQADALVKRKEKEIVHTAWRNWRVKRLGRRTDRWKEEMREKEVVLLRARQERLTSSVFKSWRFATAQHRAVSFNAAFVIASAFHQWAQLTQRMVRMRRIEQRHHATRDRDDLERAWVTWRRNLALRDVEGEVMDVVADNLESGAWQMWRIRLAERQRTMEINDKRILHGAMIRWKTRMSKLKSLAKRAHGVMVDRDASVQRLAFNAWLASHNSKVVVEIRQDRHLRSALNVWKGRMDHIVERHRQALAFDDKHIVNAARAALATWRNRNARCQLLQQQTTVFADRVLHERMLRMWKDKVAQHKTSWVQAAGTRKFFLIKASWDKWHAKHQQKQQELFLLERKREECRKVFAAWLATTKRTKSLRLRNEEFAKSYSEKRERVVFAHWMTRLIDIKDRAHNVASNADRVLIRDAFQSWTRATVKQGEALSLMHSFRYVRQQEQLHKIFHHWHFAYKEHRARRQILENKLERDRLAVLTSTFGQWRYRIREGELAPLAEDLRQKFDDGLVYAALTAWKGASRRLPAIEFHGKTLKRHTWRKWKAALPEARRLRSAARAGDDRLMGDMLFKWKLAYRARVTRRVAARSRGGAGLLRMRPSGEMGLPSPVSRTPSPVANTRSSRRRALFRLDAEAQNT
ncbi:hypothetical protein QFC22_004784 [Naganishia vaughanmartiniae]|uniref:Uncharacterized protein n=1 Tax=Naganishia vaughanmartiniae TaxID=1424756 RepID=A0ACC2WYU9_9TREE|nr:hypothetical protein QFC22_004784 [Naganishia vaughanmartiniae]